MSTRGIFDRNGEVLGYLAGNRLYDNQDNESGELRGSVILDLNGERRWLVDRDALLDLRGNVIGYLGQQVPDDSR